MATDTIKCLPSMPPRILALRESATEPALDLPLLTPLIKGAPGLSADLLRFVNAPTYGIKQGVGTIEEALLHLGMYNLADFASAAFAMHVFRTQFGRLDAFDACVSHARRIAWCCFTLAGESGKNRHDQEVYAVMGLLHNMGQLILAHVDESDPAGWLSAPCREDEQPLERQASSQIALDLARKWHLPGIVQEGIMRQHHPLLGTHISLPGAILHLAHLADAPNGSDATLTSALPTDVLAQLPLSPDRLLAIRAACRGHAQQHGCTAGQKG